MSDPQIYAAYEYVPPSDITGLATTDPTYKDALFSAQMNESVSGTAVEFDLADDAAGGTDARNLAGGCWVTFEAKDADIWVRLRGHSRAAATTADTGTKIVAGTKEHFWVTEARRYADVIASAADTMLWWRSSRRRRH